MPFDREEIENMFADLVADRVYREDGHGMRTFRRKCRVGGGRPRTGTKREASAPGRAERRAERAHAREMGLFVASNRARRAARVAARRRARKAGAL